MTDLGTLPTDLPTTPTFLTSSEATWAPLRLPDTDVAPPSTRSLQRSIPAELTIAPSGAMPETGLAILPHGRLVTASGAVIDRSGRLVLQSLYDDEHRAREFGRARTLPPPTVLSGRTVAVVSLWSHGYYHWLFEALPRLALLQASGISFDRLVIPEGATSFHRRSLELAGFGDVPTHPLSGGHVQADELVWLSPTSPVGYPTPRTVDWLRSTFHVPDAAPWRRIYVPRRHSRRVANERQVARLLIRSGFDVVDPDELDLAAQVELFAQARVMAGPHGAAFANGVFSRRLTAIEFYQPAHLNSSTTAALAGAGHEHWTVVGPRIPRWSRPTHQNVYVPPLALKRTLERALSDLRRPET
jgi:capsular polysaccharide biosynthesis protein